MIEEWNQVDIAFLAVTFVMDSALTSQIPCSDEMNLWLISLISLLVVQLYSFIIAGTRSNLQDFVLQQNLKSCKAEVLDLVCLVVMAWDLGEKILLKRDTLEEIYRAWFMCYKLFL